MTAKEQIIDSATSLGIELGSTRIKAVLIGDDFMPIAVGTHDWENRLENGIWTYSIEDILNGISECYSSLSSDVFEKYGIYIENIGSIGISAMMHGYLAFDERDNLLVPFRTWRNTMTEEASRRLTELFEFPIPQRFSISHLYQAILNGEEHTDKIKNITTLAGFVHYLLSGERVLGVGDASGMFPIDLAAGDYDEKMASKFDNLHSNQWSVMDILPRVLMAGENGGYLTANGARLLDKSGRLKSGALMCAPEGDAGTGMTATNSVAVRTGNVSAGTSVFAMVVLEKQLKKLHSELDLVTTPSGDLVAMVHCNNCSSDLNSWFSMFGEFAGQYSGDCEMNKVYDILLRIADKADKDCGGLVSCNYLSGEHITGFSEGRPLFVRGADSSFGLGNFIRNLLYSAFSTLKIGLDILIDDENVEVSGIVGHGGLFRTKGVAQGILSAACKAPVSVMETAGEGGAWGAALLAAYSRRISGGEKYTLSEFLGKLVFGGANVVTIQPSEEDIKGFEEYIRRYKQCLKVEKSAIDNLNGV